MLFVSVVPGYFFWRELRLSGASQHADCTVSSVRSSNTVDDVAGKVAWEVSFELQLPDGSSFDGEDVVRAPTGSLPAYHRGQSVLCFHVPGRPDLLVLEPRSLTDWLLPGILTAFCLGTAVVLSFWNRARPRG